MKTSCRPIKEKTWLFSGPAFQRFNPHVFCWQWFNNSWQQSLLYYIKLRTKAQKMKNVLNTSRRGGNFNELAEMLAIFGTTHLEDTWSVRQQEGQLQCPSHHWSAQWQCFWIIPHPAILPGYSPSICYIQHSAHTIRHPWLSLSFVCPHPLLRLFPSSSVHPKSRQLQDGHHVWQQCCKAQLLFFSLIGRY